MRDNSYSVIPVNNFHFESTFQPVFNNNGDTPSFQTNKSYQHDFQYIKNLKLQLAKNRLWERECEE